MFNNEFLSDYLIEDQQGRKLFCHKAILADNNVIYMTQFASGVGSADKLVVDLIVPYRILVELLYNREHSLIFPEEKLTLNEVQELVDLLKMLFEEDYLGDVYDYFKKNWDHYIKTQPVDFLLLILSWSDESKDYISLRVLTIKYINANHSVCTEDIFRLMKPGECLTNLYIQMVIQTKELTKLNKLNQTTIIKFYLESVPNKILLRSIYTDKQISLIIRASQDASGYNLQQLYPLKVNSCFQIGKVTGKSVKHSSTFFKLNSSLTVGELVVAFCQFVKVTSMHHLDSQCDQGYPELEYSICLEPVESEMSFSKLLPTHLYRYIQY